MSKSLADEEYHIGLVQGFSNFFTHGTPRLVVSFHGTPRN